MNIREKFQLTINGEGVDAETYFDVINPATEGAIGRAPDASKAQLDEAVAAARAAYPAWKALPIAQRQAKVAAMADRVAAHVEELKHLLTAEQGKPLADSAQDILTGAFFCSNSAALTPPVEVHEDSQVRRTETHHVPMGVVGAIAPWNVPVALALWKVAPALVAGNTVVLKPSPLTPLTTLRIGELLRDLLPPGVLNVISGGDHLGPWMTSHSGFDKISFTGSTATGRKVMESAAPTLKRLTLELGGNDAAIVLEGVDIPKVAAQLFHAAFFNSGQICIATKRLYIHESIYEPFAKTLVELARAAKVGNGAEQDTNFGPIQNRQQYLRVKELIADSRANGHKFLLGENGSVPEKGYFVPLTILDNPPAASRIVQEEQFGPILPLLRFKTIDEVVELANSTNFGLAASVWGPPDQAAEIAHRLEAGTVWVNEWQSIAAGQPFGGHKQSGIGVENGMSGLLSYTNAKTIATAAI